MASRQETYYAMAMRKAGEHKKYFQTEKLSAEVLEKYQDLADRSHAKQAAIEAGDTASFDEFLSLYYRQ